MREMTILLLVLAGTAVVPAYTALAVRYRKKHPPKEYDERQKIAQGEANGEAFWVLVLYFLVFLCIYGWRGMVHGISIPAEQMAWVIAVGLIVALLVYHTSCFLTHAALPLNKKPQRMMASYFFSGALELLNYYLRCWWYPDAGEGLSGHLWLLMGVTSCYLGVLYLIEWLRNRKEACDGEE